MENTNNTQNKQPNIIKRAASIADEVQRRFESAINGRKYNSLQTQVKNLDSSDSWSNNKKQAVREKLDDDTVFGAHFRLMSSPSHYTYSGEDAVEQMFGDKIMIEEFIEDGVLPANASSFYTHISPKKLEKFKTSKLSREELIAKISNKENVSILEVILLFTLADARELCNFDDASINEFVNEEIQKIKIRATKRNSTGIESEKDRAEIEKLVELGEYIKLLVRNAKKYYKESVLGGLTSEDAPQKA